MSGRRIDKVQVALDGESGLDGGLEWVQERKVLLVRLVGPIDGSSPAVEHAKVMVLTAGKGYTIEFEAVGSLEPLGAGMFTGTALSSWCRTTPATPRPGRNA